MTNRSKSKVLIDRLLLFTAFCVVVVLFIGITGCDAGYGKTMSFKLVSMYSKTNQTTQIEVVVPQVVSIVGQVADKYGFQMDQQIASKTNDVGEIICLCFYVRGSERGTGRLVLDVNLDRANKKLYVHIGKFHTAQREAMVANIYSEIRSRLASEVGLRIEPSP